MRTTQPHRIGELIDMVLQQLGLGTTIKRYRVLQMWPEIVGERIAQVARAERLEDGKLFVRVSRAPWRNELTFLKKGLIDKINKAMNQEIVKDIIFR